MKKSQRARLAELTNKAEADRSAVEKAEFGFLSALATAHPDASKDIDDTTPAAAANATQPPTAAASPVAGANAPPVTFRGFVQSLRTGAQTGSELVTARQSVTTLTANLATANATITARDGVIASQAAQLSAFASFFGITAAELAGKPAADVTALIQQKISDQALEQVAAIGVPAASLPKQTNAENGGADTLEEIQAALATEKNPEKAGLLAAKANALRDKAWGVTPGKN